MTAYTWITLAGVFMFSLPILYITWRSLSDTRKRRGTPFTYSAKYPRPSVTGRRRWSPAHDSSFAERMERMAENEAEEERQR